ncbi:DUF4352 domain-containing protein [Exiguobacterium flavidum]|uniref:DUF4352 domain-containing protein n=1 Tax=Exiguobacterium flavidum TaxID=2184695 RepID=UPI000DF7FD7A|nr:DUF4352 domain-containing protein [Exiguobacterium flavidum]
MLKRKWLGLSALALLLTGCAEEQTRPVAKQAEAAPLEKKDVYVPNPQVTDDRKLLTPGQSVADRKGELTLKKINQTERKITVGPVELTVHDEKVFHARPDYGMIDFFHGFTHDESFDVWKTRVTVRNTGDEPVRFNPVAHVFLGKEEKTLEDDIYLEGLGKELAPHEKRTGNIGFIVEQEPKTVEWWTSDAVDGYKKSIEKGKQIPVK